MYGSSVYSTCVSLGALVAVFVTGGSVDVLASTLLKVVDLPK